MHATWLTHLILLDLITLVMFGKVYKLWAPHYAVISAASHHFLLSLMSKYSPKHPILKHPQYMFFS